MIRAIVPPLTAMRPDDSRLASNVVITQVGTRQFRLRRAARTSSMDSGDIIHDLIFGFVSEGGARLGESLIQPLLFFTIHDDDSPAGCP